MKLFSFRMRATSVFIFDTGMSTRRCFDPQALRMRVSMSAIGSVIVMDVSYQLALRTPGIMPDNANSLKQIRQRPKRRRYAFDRPQRLQRLFWRTLNLALSLAFSIRDFGGIYAL